MRISSATSMLLFSVACPLVPLQAQGSPAAVGSAPQAALSATTSASSADPGSAPSTPTLLVFSDFECPYSAETFKQLERGSKGTAHVRVVFKQTPLPIHPGARMDALAALAAGRQGRYEPMAELLFSNQGEKTEDALASFARQLGLNEAQFRRDLKSSAVRDLLDADLAESEALGVAQTPTLFLGGKRIVGLQTEASLAALLKPAAAPVPPPASPVSGAPLDSGLVELLETRTARTRGFATAPVTVVEFTDFQCPFCRQAVAPMEKLLAERGREVRWVFRSFPLSFHPDAEPAAEAAFAAGAQGQFWAMHDLLFAHQNALAPADLRRYAEQLHLDMPRFDEAMRTHRYAGEVAADRTLGEKAGVNGTPSFVIDGQMVTGVRSVPELEQIVDATLQHAPGRPARSPAAIAAETPVIAPHPVYGPESGVPLVITWFTDVRSPLAQRQATLIHMLTDHYDGKVTVLYKAYPLQSHSDGQTAAAALLAAQKQARFWPMYDALSEERSPVDRDSVVTIAAHLELNMTRFLADFDSGSAAVLADLDEAARRGVMGAPVIFLNESRVDGLQRDAFYTNLADRMIGPAAAAPRAAGN